MGLMTSNTESTRDVRACDPRRSASRWTNAHRTEHRRVGLSAWVDLMTSDKHPLWRNPRRPIACIALVALVVLGWSLIVLSTYTMFEAH